MHIDNRLSISSFKAIINCKPSNSYHDDMCFTRRIYCHHYHMDGAFIAKFVLESNVNEVETSATMKLLQRQTTHKEDRHDSTPSRNAKTKHTPAKVVYKKGSHEWLKRTFMGEEKIDEDYSDDD